MTDSQDQRLAFCDYCRFAINPLTFKQEYEPDGSVRDVVAIEPIPADISITQELLDQGDRRFIVQDGPFVGLAGVNYELLDRCPAAPKVWHARRTS